MEIGLFLIFITILSVILCIILKIACSMKCSFYYQTPVKIVLSTKDSEDTIECFLRSFIHQLNVNKNAPFLPPEELVVVDLDSQDNTFEILKKLSLEYPYIHPMTKEDYINFLNTMNLI
ncbi:MAG: hypothetical protein J6D15_00450 [Clostridia bacterium]|nr:hypothetical protein [Clostridia bacterium]